MNYTPARAAPIAFLAEDVVLAPPAPPLAWAPRAFATEDPGGATRFAARLVWSLAEIEPIWARLEATGHATVYQGRPWVRCVIHHLAGPAGARPFHVVVSDADTGAVLMILPLMLTRRLGVRTISWLNLDVCDYATPLLAPGVRLSPEEAAAAFAAVETVLPACDLLDITQIPESVGGVDNPLALLRDRRLMSLQHFGATIEGDPTTIVARRVGGKAHRQLRKQWRRLEARGATALVEATSEAEVSTMFATLVRQRGERFRKLGRAEILTRPEILAFYEDMASRSLGGRGPARIFGLMVGAHMIATAYVLVQDKAYHGIILAMDDDGWAKFSPGLLLVCELMAWSAREGHVYHDMTVGDLPYKEDLGAKPQALYRVIRARTPVGAVAAVVRLAIVGAKDRLRAHPRLFQAARGLRHDLRRRGILP
jgi:CelD/BcsL family acetyltransferase involved in cellulose biosynthesis